MSEQGDVLSELNSIHSTRFQRRVSVGTVVDQRQNIEKETLQELKATFSLLDVCGQGFITIKSLAQLMESFGYKFSKQELVDMVTIMDLNKDDMVSFDEFLEIEASSASLPSRICTEVGRLHSSTSLEAVVGKGRGDVRRRRPAPTDERRGAVSKTERLAVAGTDEVDEVSQGCGLKTYDHESVHKSVNLRLWCHKSFQYPLDCLQVMIGQGFHELAEDEEKVLKRSFHIFDRDDKGFIDASDLSFVIKCFGLDVSVEELDDLIEEVDGQGDGRIDFETFVAHMCSEMPDFLKKRRRTISL